MPDDKRPILVTGAHRTGTSWVGQLLAEAPGIAYISEPLNVWHRPGVFSARVQHWYNYICQENEDQFLSAFRDLLAYRYHLLPELASLRSIRDLARLGRDLAVFVRARSARSTPLLKDPFAAFSLPWFASRLGCRIVVTVRHPAAFASGLKRLGWSFDFSHLLHQPLLMRDHLELHRAELEQAPDDVIGQAGLLWTLIYRALLAFMKAEKAITLVRHEDLAVDPESGFRQLYVALGLPYSSRVDKVIARSSSAANPTELARNRTHSVKMDSRASLGNWKRRLSTAEVARVREITNGVWQQYYAEGSWE